MRSSVVDAVVAVGEVSLDLARELAPLRALRLRQPRRQPARPRRAADGHPGHGRGRQAPAAAGRRRLGALRRGGLGARRRVRGAAHGRASRRRLPPRGQRLARRAGAAARAARRSCRGRSGSRSSPRPPRRLGAAWPAAAAGERGARRAGRAPGPRRGRAGRAGRRRAAGRRARGRRRAARSRRCPIRGATARSALLVCSRRGDPAVLERGARGLRRRRRRGRRPPQLRAARDPARALGARARARPAGASRGARRAGARPAARVQIAALASPRPCSRARASRPTRCAPSWPCSGAPPRRTARTPLEELRARAAWPDVPPPADLVDAAVAALGRERRRRAEPPAACDSWPVAGKSDLAASPAYALTRAGAHARSRGWTRCWPGARRTRPRPRRARGRPAVP